MQTINTSFKGFISDNCSGIHPKAMDAIINANSGHEASYGDDFFTKSFERECQKQFGDKTRSFIVCTGTSANVIGLQSVLASYQSVITSQHSHLHVHECGAFEKATGSKLVVLPSCDGKISVDDLNKVAMNEGFVHTSQPKVVSITQPTELGVLYSQDEIKEICRWAHSHDLYVHVDGARIANAAASMGKTFRELTFDLGVDVLSFGATKNGLYFAEAVVFASDSLARHFPFMRKQSMQLVSKMRYQSAQFLAYFDGLWQELAQQANKVAAYLSQRMSEIEGVKIFNKTEVNIVMASVPKHFLQKFAEDKAVEQPFIVWDKESKIIRLVTSFDSSKDEVDSFIDRSVS